MSDYRIAAWTLPGVGTFEPIDSALPIVAATIQDTMDGRGRITATVPEGYDWQRLVFSDPVTPANNKSCLLRVYRAGDDNTALPVAEFKAERHKVRLLDDGSRGVDLFGPDWRVAGLDEAILMPWDWVDGATSTVFGNWEFGSEDLVDNPTFAANVFPSTWELWNDATGGTFTITVSNLLGSDTTGSLAYNASAATVAAAVLGLTTVSEVSVTGVGTSADPWIIEVSQPVDAASSLFTTDSLTGGSGFSTYTKTQVGGVFDPLPWTPSQDPQSGQIDAKKHGQYGDPPIRATDVNLDPGWAYNGGEALKINGITKFSGAQQIVAATPGSIVQLSVDVGPQVGTDRFRAILRDMNEQPLTDDSVELTLTAGQYNTVAISDVQLPDDLPLGLVIFRVANLGPVGSIAGDPVGGQFYIRQTPGVPMLQEGLGSQNIGVIADLLLEDAQTDHTPARLTWLDRGSWTTSVDSDAVAWPGSEALRLAYGRAYGSQIFQAKFASLGYEWDLVPATASTWELEIWNEGGRGVDRTAAGNPGFVWGFNIGGGEYGGRIPKGARLLAAGRGGILAESVDATQEANFGPTQWFVRESDITEQTTLATFADFQQSQDLANLAAVEAELVPDTIVPYVDFDIGDKLSFTLPGLAGQHTRRISAITLGFSGDEWVESVTASKLFSGQHAVNQAVLDLLSKFDEFEDDAGDLAVALGQAAAGMIVVVASDNSPDAWKEIAKFVGVGGNTDEQVIQAGIDYIEDTLFGADLVLAPGIYNCTVPQGGAAITIPPAMRGNAIRGAGQSKTAKFANAYASVRSSAAGTAGSLFEVTADDFTFSSFHIRLNATADIDGITVNAGRDYCRLDTMYLEGSDHRIMTGLGTDVAHRIENCYIVAPSSTAGRYSFEFTGNCSGITFRNNYGLNWNVKISAVNLPPGNMTFAGNDSWGASVVGKFWLLIDLSAGSGDELTGLTIEDNNLSTGWSGVKIIGSGETIYSDNTAATPLAGRIDRNWFSTNGLAVHLVDVSALAVNDNDFHKCGRDATTPVEPILWEGVTDSDLIRNRIFFAPNDNLVDAIHLKTGCDDNNVRDNIGRGPTYTVDADTRFRYFVNISTADCDDNIVIGNDGRGAHGTGLLNDVGTGTVTAWPTGGSGANFG